MFDLLMAGTRAEPAKYEGSEKYPPQDRQEVAYVERHYRQHAIYDVSHVNNNLSSGRKRESINSQ